MGPAEILPERADVVVVGAGLAGLRITGRLAASGVDVVLLEARGGAGQDASGRDPGLLTPGLPESVWRTAAAMGQAGLVEILDLGDRCRAAADAMGALGAPALFAASDDREVDDLGRSIRALRDAGRPVVELGPAELNERLGAPEWRYGYLAEGDRTVDIKSWIQYLRQTCGSRVWYHQEVVGVDSGASLMVRTRHGGRVRAEVVVYCCGYPLGAVDTWFADKLTPVREVGLRFQQGGAPVACRTQLGYSGFARSLDDTVVFGCRWATPHLEVGETAELPSPSVVEKLRAFAARRAPWVAGAGDAEVRIVTHTCDGLPFVGPLPGDARRVACTGFLGVGPALAVACADQVVGGLLVGATGSRRLAPARLVG